LTALVSQLQEGFDIAPQYFEAHNQPTGAELALDAVDRGLIITMSLRIQILPRSNTKLTTSCGFFTRDSIPSGM